MYVIVGGVGNGSVETERGEKICMELSSTVHERVTVGRGIRNCLLKQCNRGMFRMSGFLCGVIIGKLFGAIIREMMENELAF